MLRKEVSLRMESSMTASHIHILPSPISIRDQVIKTSIPSSSRCHEARALRLGCWEHIIIRIIDMFQHLDVYTFESAQRRQARSTESVSTNKER